MMGGRECRNTVSATARSNQDPPKREGLSS